MISLPSEQSHVPMKLKFKCSRQGVKGIEAWIWIEFHREECEKICPDEASRPDQKSPRKWEKNLEPEVALRLGQGGLWVWDLTPL